MSESIKFIELFAGIGGFRYGLETVHNTQTRRCRQEESVSVRASGDISGEPYERQHTFTCVYANEWDKYATTIYKKHYGKIDTRDITTVKAEEIPDHDLLVGGFPCQAFSIAGKRGGFEDTRGTLFFEIARILQQKQPRLLLLENVKGLLSHDKGKTFGTILNTLSELGYDLQWQVLNSKNFGVPQNRERVFIVGHLRGTSRPEVFPIREENKRNLIVDAVIGTVKVRKHVVNVEELKTVLRKHKNLTNKQIAEKLKQPITLVEHWFRTDSSFSIPDVDVWFKLKKLLTIKTNKFDKSITEFEVRDNKFEMANRIYQKEGISPTITTLTGGQQHTAIDDGYSIRRLTPTECERLQGFPDGYTEGISDTQRYKCLGNAVTTNVITAIGEKLC